MSETVKLIIEIPKDAYRACRPLKTDNDQGILTFCIVNAVADGIPLDDVKAEIKRMEYHMIDCEVLVSQDEVLEILDNIGKGE